MTQTNTQAALYVGTYAKYNSGSIEGAWLKLSDYSDASEFMAACFDLHKDEEDPELMFQDFEGFPRSLYGESMSETEIEAIYNYMEVADKLEGFDGDDWVRLHNEYCQNNGNSDDEIFSFDEDFFNTYFEGKPMEAARAASFGELNWSDDYIKFNGYGNLVSISKWAIDSEIDKEAIIADIIENPENYSL